ncbi:hypothetical protein Vafri_20461 [Volvox africanus]|uniref:Uncharacterized protein n=1 Tax=Volvox africanus TaxID=51714 RepID=A0A8J4FDX0_9CHLO|nr:hypothetical protein Vafri_20461 [Volvox africanus]
MLTPMGQPFAASHSSCSGQPTHADQANVLASAEQPCRRSHDIISMLPLCAAALNSRPVNGAANVSTSHSTVATCAPRAAASDSSSAANVHPCACRVWRMARWPRSAARRPMGPLGSRAAGATTPTDRDPD